MSESLWGTVGFVSIVYIVATRVFERDINRKDVARWLGADVAVVTNEDTGGTQIVVQTDERR